LLQPAFDRRQTGWTFRSSEPNPIGGESGILSIADPGFASQSEQAFKINARKLTQQRKDGSRRTFSLIKYPGQRNAMKQAGRDPPGNITNLT
jgi:hypothetical protein